MTSGTINLSPALELDRLESYVLYSNGIWQRIVRRLPEEQKLSIFVNGRELISILCTPKKLNCLVVGFLRSEGFIAGLDDIEMIRICMEESLADVRLAKEIPHVTPGRTITSGCGGGVAFEQATYIPPLDSSWHVSTDHVLSSVNLLMNKPDNKQERGMHGGVHVSALSDGCDLVVSAEDIGRHNTLDKIWGECILNRIETTDRLLVTTGRISSEMLLKAARMRIPVVASLNSATSRAVKLGSDLGITVVGYVRRNRMSVYSHPQHIVSLPTT